jgi:hypothetical protein
MNAMKNKKRNKLSSLKRNNKGLADEALRLVLLSVLLMIVIGIVMSAIGGVGTTVEKATNASGKVIDAYGTSLEKQAKKMGGDEAETDP